MFTPALERLASLAALVQRKNAIDEEIAVVVNRPALMGHVGEYIASQVFDITLSHSASAKSIDGHFQSGPLKGRSVNVKWYGKLEGLLDLTEGAFPDYYLVLTGPRAAAVSSRGGVRPWSIQFVFLFYAPELVRSLEQRGVRLGVATSVHAALWDAAEVYPRQTNPRLALTDEQRAALALFA